MANICMAQQIIVGKAFILDKKIGEGSFGKIFSARKKEEDSKTAYAIKLITKQNMWENELTIYSALKGIKNIPFIHAAGTEGKFHYIVMELLEQNLEQLKESFKEKMSLKVILHLGLQMLSIIEAIHDRGILHRDIKPSNFLLKTNEQNISELYLIDFGLSCKLEDNNQIMKCGESLLGTTRYMSVAVQQGWTASWRDDLESLGYILIFLQKGELPWQGSGDMTLPIKQTFGWAYASANIAGEFILFINYCRAIPFNEKPNYTYLRGLLTNLLNA